MLLVKCWSLPWQQWQHVNMTIIGRAPRYRIHGTQYKTVQSWLVFKHVSTVQCSGSSFIQIQYKTKQFLYPKFSSVQYSTASRIRYIVSTVQNSIDICFVLHWYYKIQSSKSFIGVTSISNSQNCIGQSLLFISFTSVFRFVKELPHRRQLDDFCLNSERVIKNLLLLIIFKIQCQIQWTQWRQCNSGRGTGVRSRTSLSGCNWSNQEPVHIFKRGFHREI